MYTIYAGNEILHNPMLADSGRIVIEPVLTEALNTHGSLEFRIAPTNPLYDQISERTTKIKVVSDTAGNKVWFGRVMEIEVGWDRCKTVWCEGELGCLNDSIYRPFGFNGSPAQLFSDLIATYNDSATNGYVFRVGNVSVTDPNNTIVRSSKYAYTVWQTIVNELTDSSLGGYVIPRYDKANDIHYVDYLSLDENDQYAHISAQVIEFGANLLDFVRHSDTDSVATVLIPYGAQFSDTDPNYQPGPPANGHWDGNALTIRSVNGGNDWIQNNNGIAVWGRVVGTKTWEDVTVAANLLTKATSWLSSQLAQNITVEVNAVDLSFVNADIEQIQVGDYVRIMSRPHDLNLLLLCREKQTNLTELENSSIILGAGLKTMTDIQAEEGG